MTIRELAEIANVSPATVSLVLNNKKGVAEETRKRVLELFEEYHYPVHRKNMTPTKNILFLKYMKDGMIVEENTGFIASIMDSIEMCCRNEGYNLNIINAFNNFEETVLDINYSNFSGIIVLGTELEQKDYGTLEKITIPYVVLDNAMPYLNCHSVAIGNKELVHDAIKHLVDLGYEEIAYFRSSRPIQNFQERAESFRDSIESLHVKNIKAHEFYITPTLLGAYESMKAYLQKGMTLPGCAFADNDTIAIGVMKALSEFDIRVPEELSVVGFDNIQFSAIHSPSLSTMHIAKELMGSMALKVLYMVIENPKMSSIKTRVGGKLIVRESSSANKKS